MNEKGFTLVEMIATIAIILIIAALIIPNLVDMQKDTKEDLLNSKISLIEAKAKAYAMDHLDTFTSPISIEYLIENSYLDGDKENKTIMTNPVTGKNINKCTVTLTYNGSKVIADYNESCVGE